MGGVDMHQYNTSIEEHRKIILTLALLGLGLAALLHWGIQATELEVPWYVEMPSALGLFGLLYAIFDQWVWRWPWLHTMGIIAAPDLRGQWTGTLKSSYDRHVESRPVTVTVRQTWTNMLVSLSTARSRSRSVTASMVTGDTPEIWFNYRNEPSNENPRTMNMHYGTAILRCVGPDTIEGDYFTGRSRTTYGTLRLSRSSRSLPNA